ncbi:hypothetical protein TNCV_1386651 [Trichonephila clavipes]|nr:hypothetical protein TNCV_1386651 [Trichonephila clavipes]
MFNDKILSSRLVLREWDNRNKWCDGQVCPDVGQGIMAPWSRRPRIREQKKPCPGWRELERRALDGENSRRELKKGTLSEIGVERKER